MSARPEVFTVEHEPIGTALSPIEQRSAIHGGEALVMWGMDEGSGNRPAPEQIADLELDITADWYLTAKDDANRAAYDAVAGELS